MVVDKVIKEIEKEFEEKKNEIKAKYDKIYNEKVAEIEKEKKKIVENAKKEAETLRRRIIKQKESEVNLEVKKNILKLKHEIIEEVIKKAVEEIKKTEKYRNFLKSVIDKYKNNAKLLIIESDRNIVESLDAKIIEGYGGIIVDMGREIHDYTLDSFLEMNKDDLIQQISKILWSKDEKVVI